MPLEINKIDLKFKLTPFIKLYFLLAIMSIAILVTGIYGINKFKTLNHITGTMYADRFAPIQKLSSVRFYYGTNLLSILSKVKKHQLTYKQAEIQLTQSEQKAKHNWKIYQHTFLKSKETQLLDKTNEIIKKADLTLEKLKTILTKEDSVALENFMAKELYQTIANIEFKIDQLIALQIRVSEEKFRTSNHIYHKTHRNPYIFLIILLSFSSLLGLYIIKNIRLLIKNLQVNNDQITQSENKFLEFIKYAGDSVFLIAPTYQIIEVNDSACNLLNYSKEELQNMKIYELMTEADQQSFPAESKKVDKKGGLLHERIFVKKDGSLVDTEVNVRAVEGAGYITVIRDITQRKEAETKIKEREAHLTALFENIEGSIALYDTNKKIVLFNSHFAHNYKLLTNHNPKPGDGAHDFLSEEKKKEPSKWMDSALNGNKEVFEKDYLSNDKLVSFRTSFTPVINEGKVTGITSFSLDLTKIKEAELKVLESEEKFRLAFMNSQDAFSISSFENGKIIDVNESFCNIYDYTKEEIIGKTSIELNLYFDKNDRTKFYEAVKANDFVKDHEIVMRKKNGEVVIVSISANILMLNNEKIMLSIARDITAQKRTENELIESKEQMAMFIEYSPASLAMFDMDMRYIATSRRWLTDYKLTDQDIIGKTLYEISPWISPAWKDIHQRSLNGSIERKDEDLYIKNDGTIIWLKWEIRPWHKVSGEIGGIIITTEAITEQKESELKFKNLVEKSLVGVYIVQNGEFVYVNPKFASELGYTQEEILNLNDFREIVDSEYIPPKLVEWRKKIDAGIIDDFHIELKYKRKDGTSIWAEIYCGEIIYKGAKAILGSFQNINERKKFEEQQLLMSSIVNSSNDAIISKNIDGIVTSWNKGAEKTLGYAPGEMIGHHISKIIPSHLIDEEKEILKNIRAGRSVNYYETQRVKKDGELIEVSLTISPIVDSLGRIVGASKILRDIAERKKAESALKEQSDTFEAIIENANESIWLLSPDLKVLQFNKTGKQRLLENRGKEIYLGANFKDFLHIGSEDVFMPMFNTALEGKYAELESCQKNIYGDIFWLRTRMYPIYNTQKKLIGVTVLAENITDRKKGEKLIEQSEEKNRSLIENISDTIVLVNETLEIMYQSPSNIRTAGFTLKDLAGNTVLDIIHPDNVHHASKIIEKAKSSPNNPIPFQLRILHKKGHYIWIEGTISNLLLNESVKSYVLNYRDITFRKLMESERLKITSEILQRNRDLEQFTYIVSHNLRAPVANIMGITDYLKDKETEEDEKEEMLNGLSASANTLDSVIHDLNTILQTKRDISERKETVKFSEILNDVKLSIATQTNKQITFHADFSAIDEMTTLKSYMYSIFYNLISNSIKYRQPGIEPVIEISSQLIKNKINLIFTDNGLGIDLEKNSEKVFGLYKRFHLHIEGKGMGLYMVKTQVETLGGKIAIKSKINKGTQFKIKFKIEKSNN
ncbi:PAS domain S-box protein [Flavobacterium sp. WC2509]|uniref:PAS domain S-box protein n=1 Tax=Flavobacterium sp. WC2509 TaxID=3461406 RepID=UPI004043E7CA